MSMILINEKEVLSYSKIGEFPNLDGKTLPAIQLLIDDKKYVCKIGYYDISQKLFEEKNIQVGSVLIDKISVSVSPFRQLHYQKEKLAQYYYYDVSITLIDKNGEKADSRYGCHTFHGVDKVEKSGSTVSKEFCQTFSILFSKIIPEINEVIEEGIAPQNINFDYFDLIFKELDRVVVKNEYIKFKLYWKEPIITKRDILHLIYTLDIEEEKPRDHVYEEEDHIFNIKSFKIKDLPANAYVEDLIGFPIHVNSIHGFDGHHIYPKYAQYNSDTLKRALIKELYYSVITLYDDKKAQLGFKVTFHNQRHDNFACKTKHISFTAEEEYLLNFILDMRVGVFEDGQTRVGRDDYSWTETSYIFSYEHGYKPSQDIIDTINHTLNIKLQDEEENLRWFYLYKSKAETIPDACTRRGRMDDSSREPFLNKLIEIFILSIQSKHLNDKL